VPLKAAVPRLPYLWKDSVKILGDIVYFDASEDWEKLPVRSLLDTHILI
jgi:hypothetical protein